MIELVPQNLGKVVATLTADPITRHALALYCGASGDHNPIHVDIDFARASGMPDVFAHGMLIMAYVGRLLTRMAPLEKHRSLAARFQAITQVGDAITVSAKLVSIESEKDEPRATLGIVAADQRGEVKLSGKAVIALT